MFMQFAFLLLSVCVMFVCMDERLPPPSLSLFWLPIICPSVSSKYSISLPVPPGVCVCVCVCVCACVTPVVIHNECCCCYCVVKAEPPPAPRATGSFSSCFSPCVCENRQLQAQTGRASEPVTNEGHSGSIWIVSQVSSRINKSLFMTNSN